MVYMIRQLKKLFMSHMLKNWFVFPRWQEQLNKKWYLYKKKLSAWSGLFKPDRTFRCGGTSENDTGDFHQDGASPHCALEVRRTLDKTCPARWIGRGDPIAWPTRSSDMTPLDFFLWSYVYSTRVIDLDDLKDRIKGVIATVDIDMLRRVWTELKSRLDVVFVPSEVRMLKWINKTKNRKIFKSS